MPGLASLSNSSTSNTYISRNSIYGNGTANSQIGIDLLATGDDSLVAPYVTVNDSGDGDTGGNDLLNYPVLDAARIEGTDLIVTGWSRPGTTIELYLADPDPTGFGEGETWLVSLVEGSGDDTDATVSTYGPGLVNGIDQGTDTTNRFSFAVPLASLAAPVSGGDQLTSLAVSGADTSEFGGNVTLPLAFTVNSTGNAGDNNPGNGVCYTGANNTQGQPACSLRAAIEEANALAGADFIEFDMPATETGHSGGVWTITPGSVLPAISTTITIDGTTQPGWTSTPVVELNGTSAGGTADGFTITGDNSEIRGLAINRFGDDAFNVDAGAAGTVIAGNHIGTDASGLLDRGNGGSGIDLGTGSGPTLVGGTVAEDRNIISGNGNDGIIIFESDGNTIIGNYIGTDITGNAPLPNAADGIALGSTSSNNTIGQPGSGNVLSGNANDGLELDNDLTGNIVQSNIIGLGADGTTLVPNGRHGLVIYDGVNNTQVGGTGAGEGNVISGNTQSGVVIDGNSNLATSNNTFEGNYIGTDVTGTFARGNLAYGMHLFAGANGNTIGGAAAGTRNIISGNGTGEAGVFIDGATSSNNVIRNNYIGTNVTGTAAIPNNLHGIRMTNAPNTQIIENLISGNDVHGIYVYNVGSTGTQILGNYIGTNAAGDARIDNLFDGVRLEGNSSGTVVGSPGNGNVISGNTQHGVNINSSDGNTIQANYIGTDPTGLIDLGNTLSGIYSDLFNSSNNLIGGAGAGEGNTIAFNGEGITLLSGTSNSILGNSIYANDALGIDLEDDGVTPNDVIPGDGDSGPNDLLNFPVITSATETTGIVTLTGTFDVPVGWYRFEFFTNAAADPSGNGEGETLVGSSPLTHTGSGDEPWGAAFPGSVGDIVTATLTECTDASCTAFKSTSEFSSAMTVVPGNNPPVFDQDLLDRTDPEAAWISLSAGATDPDVGDTLTYSATGLPLGLSIDSATGLISGLVNYRAAFSSPYSVEVSVSDGVNPPVTDTFTWTITNVPTTDPYVVANTGGANGGDDLLTEVDPLDFDPVTNEVDIGTGTGTINLHGLAIEPISGVLYAADADRLGVLNVDSGVFTPVGGTFGSGDGDQGTVTYRRRARPHLPTAHRSPVRRSSSSGRPGRAVCGRYGDRSGRSQHVLRVPRLRRIAQWRPLGGHRRRPRSELLAALRGLYRRGGRFRVAEDQPLERRYQPRRDSDCRRSVDSLSTRRVRCGAPTAVHCTRSARRPRPPPTLARSTTDADYQAVALAIPPFFPPSVEGTIFEDISGNAVPAGEFVGDFLNPGFAGATVRMYSDNGSVPGEPDAGDTLYASKTTGPGGHYFFSSVPAGVYWLTVDSSTLVPTAGGTGWAEQTYGPVEAVAYDGSYSFAATAGPLYGGMRPTVSDNAALLPSSEHVVRVDLSPGEEIEQTDLGFSFNVVTNLEGGDLTVAQGTLRQFISNANTVTGPNAMRFVPAVPTNATQVADQWWSLAVSAAFSPIATADTTIDGTAYDAADGNTVLDTNPSGPELELNGAAIGGYGLEISADNAEIRDLVVNRFATGIGVLGGDGSVIAGNYLGPDATGAVGEVGNSTEGIYVYGATNTVIGGTNAADRNVISGNRLRGVMVDDWSDGAPVISSGTQVIGNYIGTNAAGSAALPYNSTPAYQQIGVYLLNSPDGVIGSAAAGNVISGNEWYGMYAWGADATGNLVQGNIIGLDATATNPVPNATDPNSPRAGILLSSTIGFLVGGTGAGQGNIIAGNAEFGVVVSGASAAGNAILGNQISGNADLGIDLGGDGITINDGGDVDAGPNGLLNFPVITSAVEVAGTIDVDFDLDVPDGNYRIEFFVNTAADPSGNGEGETFVSSVDVSVTGGVPTPGSHSFAGSAGDILTATATEGTSTPFGSTSEFSASYICTPPNGSPVAADDADSTPEDTAVVIDVAANDSDPDGNLDPTTRPLPRHAGQRIDTRQRRWDHHLHPGSELERRRHVRLRDLRHLGVV